MADNAPLTTEEKQQQLDKALTDFSNGGNPNPPGKGTQDAPTPNDPPAVEEDWKAKFEALNAEFEPVKVKAAEADKYKELIDADPYDGDAEVAAIAKLKKQGASLDTALQYIKMDITTMTPLEKKVLSMQLATPGVAKEKIEKAIKQQYGLGEYAPLTGENDEPNEQDGLDRLEIEVATKGGIDEQLAQQKEDLLKPAAKPRSEVLAEQSQKDKEATLKTGWKNEVPSISSSLKAYEAKVDGLETPVKIELEGYGEDKLNEYIERLVKNGYDVTPKNVEIAKTQILKDALYDNMPKIAREIAKASNGKLDAKYIQELHNSSAHQPTPNAAVKKTKQEELDFALKNMT